MRQLLRRNRDVILGILAIGILALAMLLDEPIEEPMVEEEYDVIQWKDTDEIEEVTVETIEMVTVSKSEEPELVSLGEFFLTAYCPCTSCSSHWGYQTATETIAEEGRTVAVDPTVIPYGTVLIINGHEYIAEDCGKSVKGKHIDIFHEDHMDAKRFGEQYVEVFIYAE